MVWLLQGDNCCGCWVVREGPRGSGSKIVLAVRRRYFFFGKSSSFGGCCANQTTQSFRQYEYETGKEQSAEISEVYNLAMVPSWYGDMPSYIEDKFG